MAFIVRWTLESQRTLEEVIKFLENNWSEKEVIQFIQKVNKTINQVKEFPLSFEVSSIHLVRRATITKQISLFYGVNKPNKTIILYTFYDNRQNPDNLNI